MKLQMALDRMTIDQALQLAKLASDSIDIIEVGTSLIKEYGLASVRELKKAFPELEVLADLKTIDEGAYEFKVAYEAGADIATVMGASSIDTLAACYRVAKEFNKTMLIDLMEVTEEKTRRLMPFNEAVFCIHSPTDQEEKHLIDHLLHFKQKFPVAKRLAVAGGINLDDVKELKKFDPEIVIVGSAITKQKHPGDAAKQFHLKMNGE